MEDLHKKIEDQRFIRRATLNYLNVWTETDRGLRKALGRNEPVVARARALHEAARKYRVARGFSTHTQKTPDNKIDVPKEDAFWVRVLEITEQDSARTVDALAIELGEHGRALNAIRPKVLTSAASKLMWFVGRLDVRIYDKRAVDAMRRLCGWHPRKKIPYNTFLSAWQEAFPTFDARIREAADALDRDKVYAWSAVSEDGETHASRVMREDWFAHRVFDKMLWVAGRPAGDGEDRGD